jgi:hypothetical protein
VGGQIGALHLSPDRRWLYYLDRTNGLVGRLDTKEGRTSLLLAGPPFAGKPGVLKKDFDTLVLSRDGRTLVATNEGQGESWVQVIDAGRFEVRRSFAVPGKVYDAALRDDGMAFLSGSAEEWSDILAVDTNNGKVLGHWGGVWSRSILRLAPDQRRLYFSSQGVSPGTLDALVLPARISEERPPGYRAPNHDKQSLGGDFAISPDGRFLLCRNGTILRLSAERDEDLKAHAKIAPFLAVAIDPEGRSAWVVGRDGVLGHYAYPEFRLLGRHRLGLAAYDVAVDGKEGRLYVAGFDPRSMADRPRGRGQGDIQVYGLKELLPAGW